MTGGVGALGAGSGVAALFSIAAWVAAPSLRRSDAPHALNASAATMIVPRIPSVPFAFIVDLSLAPGDPDG